MDDSFAARRRTRLAARDWQCGIAHSHEELTLTQRQAWLNLSAAERLAASFAVSRTAWSLLDPEACFGVDFQYFGVRSFGRA